MALLNAQCKEPEHSRQYTHWLKCLCENCKYVYFLQTNLTTPWSTPVPSSLHHCWKPTCRLQTGLIMWVLYHHFFLCIFLTHWDQVMHICISNITIIGSDNGLRLDGAKPLSEPMMEYCWLDPLEQTAVKFWLEFKHFHSRKCIWNFVLKMAAILPQSQCVNCFWREDDAISTLLGTPYCIKDFGRHCLRWWLVAWWHQGHCIHQCWLMLKDTENWLSMTMLACRF